ncbi:hypothetical protein ONA00_05665 [Mycoplasmopsis cynos]|nr:PTS transporter subunit IIC [Mycoplasmopsis cynos]WAM10782.1 hypothetical protein ONA00_05665 [Mycoplasmopsis cynos]
MIGALVLRKKASQVIISTFKVIVGFIILGGGEIWCFSWIIN